MGRTNYTVKSCGKRHGRCSECQPEVMAGAKRKQSEASRENWKDPFYRARVAHTKRVNSVSDEARSIHSKVAKATVDSNYKKYIKAWLAGEKTGNRANGLSISNHVRRWLREARGEACEKCGWAGRNPVSGNITVEVEHIDGKSSNTTPDNLKLLCPNCHSLTPTYRALNRGNGRKNRPV